MTTCAAKGRNGRRQCGHHPDDARPGLLLASAAAGCGLTMLTPSTATAVTRTTIASPSAMSFAGERARRGKPEPAETGAGTTPAEADADGARVADEPAGHGDHRRWGRWHQRWEWKRSWGNNHDLAHRRDNYGRWDHGGGWITTQAGAAIGEAVGGRIEGARGNSYLTASEHNSAGPPTLAEQAVAAGASMCRQKAVEPAWSSMPLTPGQSRPVEVGRNRHRHQSPLGHRGPRHRERHRRTTHEARRSFG